jgi:ParB family chromosome partitioning protein
MPSRNRRPSPLLGTVAAMIGEASDTLVTRESRFRHSFEVPLEKVRPDPGQARKIFGDADIRALAATMAAHGQLQPVLLRKDPEARGCWVIVAGERRWRAAMSLRWPSLLGIEHDGDAEVASLIENLQRVDLTPVEEARGLRRLISDKGWSQDAAAEALGRSKSDISGILRILTLPEQLQEAVLTSELEIPKNTLIELARVVDPEARDRLIVAAHEGKLTVRAIRAVSTAGGERKDDPPPAAIRQPTLPLSSKSIRTLAEGLKALRSAAQPLTKAQRQHLMQLRDQIDAVLEADST